MKKIFCVVMAVVVFVTLGISAFAIENRTPYFIAADMIDSDGNEYLFDPETNQYLPINHVEEKAAEITRRNGHDYEFERLFEQRRFNEAQLAKQSSSINNFSADNMTSNRVDIGGNEYLFDPETNQYLPINHVEEKAVEITQRNGHDYEFERLFEQRRFNEAQLAKYQTDVSTCSYDEPIPGGVGYGAYFNTNFKDNYTTGTTAYYDIICPTTAGGDVSNYLYLTTTNRSALGVEAFISYYGQNNPYFKVYDWARPSSSRWQISYSFNDLSDYLTYKTIGGVSRQCITVTNRTYQTSSTQWTNVVWIKNQTLDEMDQIYSYTYTASLSDQIDSHYGSWGPIVETFQDYYYQDTNVIGFNQTMFSSKNSNYNYSNWGTVEYLTSDRSYIVNDNIGFSVVFSTPNYTFGVK